MNIHSTLVVLTAAQLGELVKSAMLEALAEQQHEPAPALLDRAGIARVLGVGTTTVDRLRRDGLPSILIGDSPRFEVSECVQWLKSHSGPRPR